MEQRAPRTSELISELPDSFPGDTLTLGELISALRNRAFGMGILLFAIPNIFPMPPGIPAISGGVLMLFGLQLAMGRSSLWLPEKLARRSIGRDTLLRISDRSLPWIRRFEKFSKPRMQQFATPLAARGVGAMIFVLGLVLLMPFPLLGNIPPGMAACVFGLGLVERDGLIVLLGYLASVVALALTALATYAIYYGVTWFF
ncbi:exopolysaccharide biosynthesis protein [Terrihabitans sp. B22-R8]|uniref:exopolysaccharide biosynthesis protein n=1 Tax=Terrihabitans sp. B22-R8 TaxID=3425128 RepID=UPI00403D0934